MSKNPQKPRKKPDGYTLLPTGANEIKFWKPNLLQRFAYKVGVMKDPRYNGRSFFTELKH